MARAVACLAVVALALAAAPARTAQAPSLAPVAYPDAYRSWMHVKSMVILPGHPLEHPFGGIHHVYANAEALHGLRGGRYSDGAVFVFDLLYAEARNHAISEGGRKLLGVMQRDAKRFAATGGWGFEGFAGDSHSERLVKDNGASCFECHHTRAQQSYVFTEWRP